MSRPNQKQLLVILLILGYILPEKLVVFLAINIPKADKGGGFFVFGCYIEIPLLGEKVEWVWPWFRNFEWFEVIGLRVDPVGKEEKPGFLWFYAKPQNFFDVVRAVGWVGHEDIIVWYFPRFNLRVKILALIINVRKSDFPQISLHSSFTEVGVVNQNALRSLIDELADKDQ